MRIMSADELWHAFQRPKHISRIKFGGRMYEYKFSDGEGMKTSAEELKDKIKNIDDKYKLDLTFDSTKDDISLNLERQKYSRPSDEEIRKQAEDSLKSYEYKEQKGIENEYAAGNRKLDEESQKLGGDFESQSKKIEQTYENAKESNKNTFIRRGLSRSSIMQENLKNLDESKNAAQDTLAKELKQNLEKITIERDLLETQKQSALESFNIAYAVKLSEKINKLTESAKQAEDAVAKYNNQLEEKEKKFALSQQEHNIKQDNQKLKDNKFVLDYINEYGRVGLDWLIAKEKLTAAKDSIKGLSKEQALAQIERDGYRDILGDSVYKSLINYVKGI
mgnify:FL=1